MRITEFLVFGYDESKSVFTVNLVADAAIVVLKRTDEHGETVVETTWEQASDAFNTLFGPLSRLVGAEPAGFLERQHADDQIRGTCYGLRRARRRKTPGHAPH